jgi:ribonuclease Y
MSGGETGVAYLVDIIILVVFGSILYLVNRSVLRRYDQLAQEKLAEAKRLAEEAERAAEALKREALIEAKDEAYRIRAEIERENREKRAELLRVERRLAQKEATLDRRLEGVDAKEQQLRQAEQQLARSQQELEASLQMQRSELQRVAGLSMEEARSVLLAQVEQDARQDAARLIREVEEAARRDGERRAREIITQSIQRCAVDQTSESCVSAVPLPNDEMKGRIIGREGRNIRAFETLTGVDLIIDDTPDTVVLSSFDPVRREVARIALTNLLQDGRIHPGRIEEAVKKAQAEVDVKIQEAGEAALLETGITGVAPEIVRLLGKMKYRTSYGQNVLDHSVEVAHLCGLLAAEVGANVQVAKRAGLFHDLGKAVDHEVEGPHAVIGADILRRNREHEDVILAVEAHHNDVEATSVEAVLVICADAISAARPGARRETLETYVKRLKQLEEIADSAPGVEKTFALQAGREIRLLVRPEMIDDLGAIKLARDVAKRIEEEMEYPGQIKVTVIRETRAVDYAR